MSNLPPGASIVEIDALFAPEQAYTLGDVLSFALAAENGALLVAWDASRKQYAYFVARQHAGWYTFDELAATVAGACVANWLPAPEQAVPHGNA